MKNSFCYARVTAFVRHWRNHAASVGAKAAFVLSGHPTQTHEMLFDAHIRAFTAFEGVTLRDIYNNMKTAVDKVTKGNGRIVNTRFFHV